MVSTSAGVIAPKPFRTRTCGADLLRLGQTSGHSPAESQPDASVPTYATASPILTSPEKGEDYFALAHVVIAVAAT